jgi:alkylated DNA repair dioxygenase AlkB
VRGRRDSSLPASLGGMFAAFPRQPTLFDRGEPDASAARLMQLARVNLDDTAWVDHLPAWVTGEDALMETLTRTTRWREEHQQMYGRDVAVPRLVASLPEDGVMPPVLDRIRDALSERYETPFARISVAYYRDGADSVAWHGDRIARRLPRALVATMSLGAPRRFLLRRKGGGRSLAFALGRGDLFVMGGACQRTWQHSIPKVARALPRLAVMFRPAWRESRPDSF